MSLWAPAPPPATKLGRHRRLSALAGVHVSPICLGAMSIGDKWNAYGMGAMTKESSFELLDAFYAAGGNFIDTANNYQDESSEEFLGEWMEARGVRDQMVVATKGISDTPAYIVSSANRYARMSNQTPFSIYQGAWSVLERDLEREIIPMARFEGMAIAPWNVLATGRIRTDEEEERRRQTGEKGRVVRNPQWERTETEKKVAKVLEQVARDVGASSIQAVAIAYVMQKTPYVFPIVGGRKVEHLHANIEALDIALSPEHVKTIEAAVPIDLGFPLNIFGDGSEYMFMWASAGTFDVWPRAEAIRP
ncbi:NADP-dependent oxidoreductase domain-containing protein, partial [Lenzites betulinus]